MIYYGLPTTWSEDVENQIFEGLNRLTSPFAARENTWLGSGRRAGASSSSGCGRDPVRRPDSAPEAGEPRGRSTNAGQKARTEAG